MSKRRSAPEGQVLLFPDNGTAAKQANSHHPTAGPAPEPAVETVICGTFRKDPVGLKRTFEELNDLGLAVLSPANVEIVSEKDGFVYLHGEEAQTPESLEARHLKAITQARFVWLHAPQGYVGPTAALEVGFARANGIPVFAAEQPTDIALRSFVSVVSSVAAVAHMVKTHQLTPPAPAVASFQQYYKRAALQRGYQDESTRDCLLLMLEEFGELARAVRKAETLRRDGTYTTGSEAEELADIFIYVVHLANVMGLELSDVVQRKELMNVQRFLATKNA